MIDNVSGLPMMPVLTLSDHGLYCPAADLYIDPWRPVDKAIITHAHADHARPGHRHILASAPSWPLLQHRLGNTTGQALPYGESIVIDGVRISLHPAGHILGSAQVRLERSGEVWVVSGDYKRQADPTCTPFEVVPAHTFISEVTFGLPVYRWPAPDTVFADIRQWWDSCAAGGQTAVLCCYALGKAQRVLQGMMGTHRPIYLHGAMQPLTQIYRDAGVAMASAEPVPVKGTDLSGALVLAPPSAVGTPWMRRFKSASIGFVSGWMQLRGNRRRRGFDRGFVLSDHADWPALVQTIDEVNPERTLLTHGDASALTRWMRERGRSISALHHLTRDAGDDG